jgi:hypothetical protein
LKVESRETELSVLGIGTPMIIGGRLDNAMSTANHLFAVPYVTDVHVVLDELLGDADISLFAADGTESLAFSNHDDNRAEHFSARLESGRYRLEITHYDEHATPYCLTVQAGPRVRNLSCDVD